MAQPVFDGHPLEEYFKDSGEASELMPGGTADFTLQPYLTGHPSVSKHAERMERLCFLVVGAVQSLRSLFFSDHTSMRTQAFAERFKYGVISSSLLSPALAATSMAESHKRGLGPSLPGQLSGGHSRTPSGAESTLTDSLSLSVSPDPETPVWLFPLSLTVVIAAFSARFYFFALLLLAGTLYYIHAHKRDIRSKPDVMTPSLLALQHLISAGQLWDSVINDTFTLMENEERSMFYGSTTPLTPSSSLRVALSTSLLTTQTQCDNVRQLLSAITSPPELAQLSEMYAPPSPIKSTFPHSSSSRRPLSHPGSPRGTPQTDRSQKRSTWNGSYASLALAGTPPAFQRTQRREKHRSELSALIGNTTPCPPRTRNPCASPPQPLTDVSEEEGGMFTAESSLAEDDDETSFGSAALSLYRRRVHGGLRALELSHRHTPLSPTRGSATQPRTTMSPASKYTSMHTPRHAFSLSSLHQSFQNALAAKRFACAHLLALRFDDDDDEVYWEDVRAVMSLLTSTLVDASARLSDALDAIDEHTRHLDDLPPPVSSGAHTPSSLASPPTWPHAPLPLLDADAQGASFAPAPSHVARFAAHVGAISSALADAQAQLAACVAALRDEQTSSPGHSSHPSTSSSEGPVVAPVGTASGDPAEHPALQAYARLRRELGLALRECERGRARLVQIVAPATPSTDAEDDPLDMDADADVPSDREPVQHDACPASDHVHADVEADVEVHHDDDATTHLLRATSPLHLPPPGIEHVFEAASDAVGACPRERPRLSREARIQRAQAQRAAAAAAKLSSEAPPPASQHDTTWGPSPDVVQELKDVIWKVGQRRQQLSDSRRVGS